MSETETLPDHRSYEVVALGRGETPIHFEQFGSYQGEWLLVGRGTDGFSIYRGHYGSCSGCDSYEADTPGTMEAARKFAADYEPFLVIPFATMRNLCAERTLKEVMPANFREDDYSELPAIERVAGDIIAAIKLDREWPLTVDDIAGAQNQEVRSRALRLFGAERWVREVGGTVVHKDEAGELVAAGDMTFVHVKDSSTDRRYLLRVPPTMKRVREALAWTFGLTEEQYRPTVET